MHRFYNPKYETDIPGGTVHVSWPLNGATLPRLAARFSTEQWSILITAQVMALFWWAVGLVLYINQPDITWFDQARTFTLVADHMANPYVDPRFVNPIWTSVFLFPFGHMPLPVATLIQLSIYFDALALFLIRHQGTRRTALILFTSYIAWNSSLQLNIEWIVALGLLVPVQYSLPFLMVKPQIALGYLLRWATDIKLLVRAGLVFAALLLASFLVWGFWLQQWIDQASFISGQGYNLAPSVLLTRPLAYMLGLPLAVLAVRRRDDVLGIIAWTFFVPYFASYSALILFGCLLLKLQRWPRRALIVLWMLTPLTDLYVWLNVI